MSRTEPEALRIAPSHVGLRLRFPRSHPSVTVGGRLRRVGPTFMHRRRTAFLGPRLPAQSRSLDGFWAPLTTGTSLIVPLRAFGRNRLPSAWPWALWRGITDGWVKRTTVPFIFASFMPLAQSYEAPPQAASPFADLLQVQCRSTRRQLFCLRDDLPDVCDPSSADNWVASFGVAIVRPFAVLDASLFNPITFLEKLPCRESGGRPAFGR